MPKRPVFVSVVVITLLAVSLILPRSQGVSAQVSGPGSWTEAAAMPTPRITPASTLGLDGRIYSISGEAVSGFTNVNEVFDPRLNLWSKASPVPTPRSAASAVTSLDGRIFLLGGWNGHNALSLVDIYDTQTNLWSQGPPMPIPRRNFAACRSRDGGIHVFGGWNDGRLLTSSEVYDPKLSIWSETAQLPFAREGVACALGSDGQIYVLGGVSSDGSNEQTVAAYDPSANTWRLVASLPSPTFFAAAATAPNGRLYVFGGFNHGDLNIVYSYDVSSNTWSGDAALPTPRRALEAVLGPEGHIYVIGGMLGSTPQSVVEVFTPPSLIPLPTSVIPTLPASTPTPLPLLQPIIPKTTRVLTASAMRHLTRPRSGTIDTTAQRLTLTFRTPGRMLRSLKAGDVIVVGVTPATPYGMVRKVLAVRRGSTSEQVTTEPASFAAALPSNYTINSSKQWKPACIKVTNSPLAGLVGAEVSGIVCPSFEVFLYATTAQRKQLSVMVTSGGTADLKLTFRQPLPGGITHSVFKLPGPSVTFPFGPIPIALGSSFEVTAGGSLSGAVTLGLHAALHGSACVAFDSSRGWSSGVGSTKCYSHDGIRGQDWRPVVTMDPVQGSPDGDFSVEAGAHLSIGIGAKAGGTGISSGLDLFFGAYTALSRIACSGVLDPKVGLKVDASLSLDFLDWGYSPASQVIWDHHVYAFERLRAPCHLSASVEGGGGPSQSQETVDLHWDSGSANEDGFRIYAQESSFLSTSATVYTQDVGSGETSTQFTVTSDGFHPFPARVCFSVTAYWPTVESPHSNTITIPSGATSCTSTPNPIAPTATPTSTSSPPPPTATSISTRAPELTATPTVTSSPAPTATSTSLPQPTATAIRSPSGPRQICDDSGNGLCLSASQTSVPVGTSVTLSVSLGITMTLYGQDVQIIELTTNAIVQDCPLDGLTSSCTATVSYNHVDGRSYVALYTWGSNSPSAGNSFATPPLSVGWH